MYASNYQKQYKQTVIDFFDGKTRYVYKSLAYFVVGQKLE